MIRMGTKIIEVRLFDEKRSQIKTGDEIEFTSTSNLAQKISTRVIKLHRYPTFAQLYHSLPAELFGGKNAEELTENIYHYYKHEEEERFGVIGLELQYLK